MAYELVPAGYLADFRVLEGGTKPQWSSGAAERSALTAHLVVCGLNSNGRLFFELAAIRDISSSGCRIHLCTKPQCDSPLAVRMLSDKGAGGQILFQVTWMQEEAEGWEVGARSMGSAALRTLVFPSQKT